MQRVIKFWLILVNIPTSVFSSGLPNPVAFYPLRRPFNTSDASCHDNLAGTPKGVRLVASGFGAPADTSYEFDGTSHSYINIPRGPSTDTNQSMTVLVWIYHTGTAGPILSYISNDLKLGFGLWMTLNNKLTAKFVGHDGLPKKPLRSNKFNQSSWHYVGISYDHTTGMLTLLTNERVVKRLYGQSTPLATWGSLCMGACKGNSHYFRGRISCLQIYHKALSKHEVVAAKDRCSADKTSTISDCGTSPASVSISDACGGHMTNLSGAFMSPGYPGGYLYALKCQWTIEVPKEYQLRIRLTFRKFDAPQTLSECENYVLIYDGLATWSERLHKYCGPEDKTYDWLNASKSTFRVEFSCGDHGTGGGFLAKYQAVLIVEDSSKDFSEHYTGVVIGVACAALFSVLSIIIFSQARRSLRCRHSPVHQVPQFSLSASDVDHDIVQDGAPPSYVEVSRRPELYPPTPILGRSPVGTPAHSPTSSPMLSRRSQVSLASQYITRVVNPLGMPVFFPRHTSPASSCRTSFTSQTFSVHARNLLTTQISSGTQGSQPVGNDSDENDSDPPPYPIGLLMTQVSIASQYSQPAGNSSDPPPYSALVDLGIIDAFTPEPVHTNPDETRQIPRSSEESPEVPISSHVSQQVPTSSNMSQRVPTSSSECRRIPTSSDESRQVPTSSGDSRRVSINTDESRRVIVPEQRPECVWTLRGPAAQQRRTDDIMENSPSSDAPVVNVCDRVESPQACGGTNCTPELGRVAVSESPWSLRQPEHHTSAARAEEKTDESTGETRAEGANILHTRAAVQRVNNSQVELKLTARHGAARALALNILRSEESAV